MVDVLDVISGMDIACRHGMANTKCPVCKQWLGEIWFQPPVRSCLHCYARLPSNRDLWNVLEAAGSNTEAAKDAWRRIRARASKARWARRRAVQRIIHEGDLGEARHENTLEIADLPDLGAPIRCDGCAKLFKGELLVELIQSPGEPKPLICPACSMEPQLIDKQCALCQARFPLVAMCTDGAGKFRCEACEAEYHKGAFAPIEHIRQGQKEEG